METNTWHKKLKNRVINNIIRDIIQQNDERIANTKKEDEVWKVINEVTKLKEDNIRTLRDHRGEENCKNLQ